MQRHDGLAGAGGARNPSRPAVAALDELALGRMQENRPFLPGEVEGTFKFLDIGQHAEAALGIGMREGIGLDWGGRRQCRSRAGGEIEQRLGRLLRQVGGEAEQGVLGGLAHVGQPFRRHAIAQQRFVGHVGEQWRLGCRSRRCDRGYLRRRRRDRSWHCRNVNLLHTLAHLDELGGAGGGMALDLAPLGPSIPTHAHNFEHRQFLPPFLTQRTRARLDSFIRATSRISSCRRRDSMSLASFWMSLPIPPKRRSN